MFVAAPWFATAQARLAMTAAVRCPPRETLPNTSKEPNVSLKIRLARAGAKKRPYYHIVIADSRSPRDGRFIERVGSYNPMLPAEHADRIRLQDERITHWLSQGAIATDRVARFIGKAGLAPMPAFREQPIQSAPKKKAQERAKAAADAAAA
jgi:small subunit ribosomal protein S16